MIQHGTAPALAVHGGDLSGLARELGCALGDLLDFSANLNPLGPPESLLRELARAAADVEELQRYPEPDAAALRAMLARELSIESATIVVGNGAAALLDVAVAALGIRTCAVPVPAFSEDARALAARGAELVPVRLDPATDFRLDPTALATAIRTSGADAVLVTNPHNPTGAISSAPAMRDALAAARDAGARAAIVDEAFVDFAPEASITRDASCERGLVVIRSLTKFYAVPALRVGYAVAEPELARTMRALLPSWPVGSLETLALGAALADRAYSEATLATVARERAALASALRTRGFGVTESAANFLFLRLRERDVNAATVASQLARDSRVVVRDCTSYAGLEPGRYLRVAVRGAAENARLLTAIDRLP